MIMPMVVRQLQLDGEGETLTLIRCHSSPGIKGQL